MLRIKTGFISGLIGTIIVGAMLLMNNALHGVPEIHITRTLARLLGAPDQIMVGVVAILIVGIFIFGALFAVYSPRVPAKSYFIKSLPFAAASWLFIMLIIMPLGSSGLFGLNGGAVVPVTMLVLNLVYWAVLGVTYRWLSDPVSASNSAQDSGMSMDSGDRR